MKLKIQYNGFTLRTDTEFVNRSSGAELFLTEMNIPYEVKTVGDREVLEYAEHPEINVPWYSVHMFKDMAERYGCTFNVDANTVSVQFK